MLPMSDHVILVAVAIEVASNGRLPIGVITGAASCVYGIQSEVAEGTARVGRVNWDGIRGGQGGCAFDERTRRW